MLEPGWLGRHFERVAREVESWPPVLRGEAGLDRELVPEAGSREARSAGPEEQATEEDGKV
jgi:hypothetical protein